MQRIIGLMVVTLMMVLAIGCSSDENPVTSDLNQILYKPHTPVAPAIGDRVWHDSNMDGIQGDTLDEPGLEGIVVHLYQCNDTLEMAMTITDVMGYYSFDSLAPGEYKLHFVLPDGYYFSPAKQGDDDALDSDADPATGWTECVSIDSGEVNIDVDAGMYMMPEGEGCTRSKGFWKNHAGLGPQDDLVTDLLPIMLGSFRVDTIIVDSTIIDTIIFDTTIYDTIIVDTTIYDTIIVDTTIVDTVIVDTIIADTLVVDTIIIDTTITDTTIVDSTISDTTVVDSTISDTTIVDSTISDTTISGDMGKSIEVTDAQMAFDILQQHTFGHPSNGITKLYAHFLATKLNIANGANADDIMDAIAEADEFLWEYDWTDWGSLDKDQKMMVSKWKSTFAAYNGGETGPGCCDDLDGDGDCNDGDDWDGDYSYDDAECDNDSGNGIDCSVDEDVDYN